MVNFSEFTWQAIKWGAIALAFLIGITLIYQCSKAEAKEPTIEVCEVTITEVAKASPTLPVITAHLNEASFNEEKIIHDNILVDMLVGMDTPTEMAAITSTILVYEGNGVVIVLLFDEKECLVGTTQGSLEAIVNLWESLKRDMGWL